MLFCCSFDQAAAGKDVGSFNVVAGSSSVKPENYCNSYSPSCGENCDDVESIYEKKNMVAGTSESSMKPVSDFFELKGLKRPNESEEPVDSSKKILTTIVDSDDESHVGKDNSVFSKCKDKSVQPEGLTGVNSLSSRSLTEKLRCTACDRAAIEVQQHPVLKVIICQDCKWLLEKKLRMKV